MKTRKKANRGSSNNFGMREKIIPLICEIDDSLGTARAFGRSLELMSHGLQGLNGDYGVALMTVTETVLRLIDNARDTCNRLRSEIEPC